MSTTKTRRPAKFDPMSYMNWQHRARKEMASVAMEIAKDVCKRGYDPIEADAIVHLTAEQLQELAAWYETWSAE